MLKISDRNMHESFLNSKRKHVLMITNHGVHTWRYFPGIPDTGGQNIFVNSFTNTMAEIGFKITIANRGGFPHPVTGERHEGLVYKDSSQRILYIEDDRKEFICKEDMDERIPQLSKFLINFIDSEGLGIDLIVSHYWDGAKIGVLLNQGLDKRLKHVWIPHSLGAIKKKNMEPNQWGILRIDERIENEKMLIPELDAIAATSLAIAESLKNDYGYDSKIFMPPCIDATTYFPMEVPSDHSVWAMLAKASGISVEKLRDMKIVSEFSRTDKTKRKDILIKALANIHNKHPNTLLVMNISPREEELYRELHTLIKETGIPVAAVSGFSEEDMPYLYRITDIYCSPSVMEGFGMSAQQAAATRVPVVGSTLVPFVKEYLIGDTVKNKGSLKIGEGAIMVEADDVNGFSEAIDMLIGDKKLHDEMAENAYRITIPYFTWKSMIEKFLDTIGI